MSLREWVIYWNNTHRYDSWWRKRHNVAFNSLEHRRSCQFDIAIEYIEHRIEQNVLDDMMKQQAKKEEMEKTGSWLKVDQDGAKKVFDKISLKDFING